MRLRVGMYVRTSYGTGPYEIVHIKRNCTCPKYLDIINTHDPPASRIHIHLTCCDLDNPQSRYFLNGYDEETLTSVWSNDRLYVVSPRQAFRQKTLFEDEE